MDISSEVDVDYYHKNYDCLYILGKLQIKKKNELKFLNSLNLFGDITVLICTKVELKELPELPETLIELDCNENKLTILPKLPKTLIKLNVSINKLTILPKLPKKLKEFNCNCNLLTSLPKLSKNLRILNCMFNKLTYLPELPKNLKILSCVCNELTYLPELPDKLKSLNCSDNKIIELPFIPINIKGINFRNNNFCDILYSKTLEKSFVGINILYMKITPIIIQELNMITFSKKANDRMKIIRFELLDQSAKIVMNPKRISRLIESGEISFYDDSMDNLT